MALDRGPKHKRCRSPILCLFGRGGKRRCACSAGQAHIASVDSSGLGTAGCFPESCHGSYGKQIGGKVSTPAALFGLVWFENATLQRTIWRRLGADDLHVRILGRFFSDAQAQEFNLESFISKRWWIQQQMAVKYLPKSGLAMLIACCLASFSCFFA